LLQRSEPNYGTSTVSFAQTNQLCDVTLCHNARKYFYAYSGNISRLLVKSGSAEERDVGVLMGKKQEIMRDISRFLPGSDEIVQTFAMGITQDCGSLP